MEHECALVLSDSTIVEAQQQAGKLILHAHLAHTLRWPPAVAVRGDTLFTGHVLGHGNGIPGYYSADRLASQQ